MRSRKIYWDGEQWVKPLPEPAAEATCEHGVPDGDWCEPCNREYKRAAVEAGYESVSVSDG